ncbi:MAG: molecular chaperone [Alkalispirochaeta sp.]
MRRYTFLSHGSKWIMVILTTLTIAAAPLAAFQLQPMSASIDPQGGSSTTTFDVRNTTDAPVAVQMRVTTRSIQPDGTELNEDASDQLQLFPSQIILQAGQTQTVRVRWIGDGVPATEQPFRVVAEQLPVNLSRDEDEASGVRMMLRYRATLYVRPAGVEPDVVVTEFSVSDGEVSLTIENQGTAHALLADGLLVVDSDGEESELPAEDIEALATVNILPGGVRRLRIPVSDLPEAPDEISFRFDR